MNCQSAGQMEATRCVQARGRGHDDLLKLKLSIVVVNLNDVNTAGGEGETACPTPQTAASLGGSWLNLGRRSSFLVQVNLEQLGNRKSFCYNQTIISFSCTRSSLRAS